jgi:hypothetical protein
LSNLVHDIDFSLLRCFVRGVKFVSIRSCGATHFNCGSPELNSESFPVHFIGSIVTPFANRTPSNAVIQSSNTELSSWHDSTKPASYSWLTALTVNVVSPLCAGFELCKNVNSCVWPHKSGLSDFLLLMLFG